MQYSDGNAETGGGQPIWPGFSPQPKEMTMRGDGFALALSGGIAIAVGALLPFISNVQESADGISLDAGPGINAGTRFLSLLFGLLLAGFALWIRHRPASRRGFAIASLITSSLGLAGYGIFTLIGIAGVTLQTDEGPAQATWDPSIGVLLSIGGCAACAIAAIVTLRINSRR
jgi:hypothetical protein